MGILTILTDALKGLYSLFLSASSISGFPPRLSAAEERKYIEALAAGDRTARKKLIEHNLRLVAHVSKKYAAAVPDGDDLISTGTIGLIKAINTYDSNKKVKLATYASRCIENEILMYLRSMRRKATEVSLTDALEADEEGGGMSLMDLLSEESDLDERLALAEQAQKVRNAVKNTLNEREAMVIRLRYGLNGKAPMTQRETAEILGISRSYISRIEKKALEKLRNKLED